MIDQKITPLIGKAIREAKYLSIVYNNKKGTTTQFWISIQDINGFDEIAVIAFNVVKEEPIKTTLNISRIASAEILKFSYYEVPPHLPKKIEEDESLKIYEFDRYNNHLLNYYLECYKANQDPFLYKSHLIPGIDFGTVSSENTYSLDKHQFKKIIKDIYHNDYEKYYEYELAVCEFSIDISSKGKYVVAYRKLELDPVNKTLHLHPNTSFNPHFFIKNEKHTLSYYSDMSSTDFEKGYHTDKHGIIEQLRQNFKTGEMPNTRPELVVLGFKQNDISNIYDNIHEDISNNNVEIPLKAFVQQMSLSHRQNGKEPHIVLYDKNINIDQINTVYNALKYPITYVQGPPGTGKTQTILNIIVNCLTNARTVLITSNNNTPIDGIFEKLNLGEYKGKQILLPILRLGNKQYVLQALKMIKERFEYESRDTPKEDMLYKLKEKSKEKNKQLLTKLKTHDNRLKLHQNLYFVQSLSKNGGNYLLEQEKKSIENKLAETTEVTDDDLKNLYEVIKDNHQLLQFFYFESLKYQKKLKRSTFSDLIEILEIENSDKQVTEFNRWVGRDENMDKLSTAFPIILTTNLSSRKLGWHYKFDLLIMDEAGQCDIATSLIPISKCKQMVMIGDTNQLKPIIVFEESKNNRLMEQFGVDKEYNYYKNSILSLYKNIDNISTDILLRYHYRCGKKIINYSNQRFYDNQLNLSKINRTGNLKLIDVNNTNQTTKNANIEEAIEIVGYIKSNGLKDVFVITPFRNQQEVLNKLLQAAKDAGEIDESVSCGTIHKIQGQENKTIILSTSISSKTSLPTYNWIKNNTELINVGVTRAKENLIVVADTAAINILSKKDDDLFALIDYLKQNGLTQVQKSESVKLTIGFSNDSQFESEFYKTMSHYCSVKGTRFARNVKVLEVFPEELNNAKVNKKEFDGVLYEGRVPKIIFELNGSEHYSNKRTQSSDKIKMELLASKNVQRLFIPNQYVKHYEFIGELINKISGGVYQKTLFDINED